jgi:hypothetical protein
MERFLAIPKKRLKDLSRKSSSGHFRHLESIVMYGHRMCYGIPRVQMCTSQIPDRKRNRTAESLDLKWLEDSVFACTRSQQHVTIGHVGIVLFSLCSRVSIGKISGAYNSDTIISVNTVVLPAAAAHMAHGQEALQTVALDHLTAQHKCSNLPRP